MANFDTLIGMAIGTRELDLSECLDRFNEVLDAEGWETPPAEYDWEGDYLRCTLLDYGDHGRWIYIEELEEPKVGLARKFAATLEEPVEVREVMVKERTRGGVSYKITPRMFTITPDGETRDRATDGDRDVELEGDHGDLYETAAAALGILVHEGSEKPVAPPETLVVYRPEPEEDDDGIDPRVKNLAKEIKEAGEWELVEMMGQQMLRVALSDGTRRTSRVEPEEIELLTELTGIEPGS